LTTAWGQEESAPAVKAWPKKPSFSIRLGSYFASSSGTIRIDGENQGTEIDWHDVLNAPTNATVVRGRADVRIAKWFGVEAEYYRIARSQTATIDSEIIIGDETIAIGQTIASSLVQSYLDTALKFYLVHGRRLDLGLWLGATIHFVDFSVEAEPSGAAVYRNPWYPVPALGVHFSYAVLPRLYLYGKAGYFKYKATEPTTKIDAVRFDITLDYYFWKALGIGVTYAYVDNMVEMEKSPLMGMIDSRSSGFQIYGVIGF
jgi:hypothetical protein